MLEFDGSNYSVFMIEAGDELNTREEERERGWHDLQNAYFSKRILTGRISSIEETVSGSKVIINYNGFRIAIPSSEMMVKSKEGLTDDELKRRELAVINNMMYSEIDFIIKGMDEKSHSVVASRKDAMLAKKKKYFFPNEDGVTLVKAGMVAQTRIVAVGPKAVWVEIFGVECVIHAKNLAWEWIGDARDHFFVGNKLIVLLTSVEVDEKTEAVKIEADVKPVVKNEVLEKLKTVAVQGRYVGKITDINKGVMYVRLDIGVNALCHRCADRRIPGKGDLVNIVITHIDEEGGMAKGIITRILRQNI